MKTTKMLAILVFGLAMVVCLAQVGRAGPMGTAWTYQGRLIDNNSPADGLYDFQFRLYDANSDGNQVGSDVNEHNVDVIDGYFTVELDFGNSAFDGDARWLGIGVRPGDQNDPNAYPPLSPRVELAPTPYALHTRWFLVDEALNNIFAGEGAGANNTTGNYNAAMGTSALNSNTTGSYNSAMGYQALFYNTTGNYNSAMGLGALYLNTGGWNSAMGHSALGFNTTGNYNTAMGYRANLYNQQGSRNTIIGYQAGRGTGSHNKSGNVFLGYQAGIEETGSNKLYIANSDVDPPLIYGDFSTGNVGIGTTAPEGKFSIKGNGSGGDVLASFDNSFQRVFTMAENGVTVFGAASPDFSSPWSLLQVHGNMKLSSDSFAALSINLHNEAGSGRNYAIQSDMSGNFLIRDKTASQNRLAISSSGNVGIGTTSPTAKLTINGAILRDGSTMYGANSNTHINLGTSSTTGTNGQDYSSATVSGGSDNTASEGWATVGGGYANNASGNTATIGGGFGNTASDTFATVPGGRDNAAGGRYSFAAGYRAKANHQGAFVWGDSTEADFASTANDQFLIRASGGVGIGTTSPGAKLDVNGQVKITDGSQGAGRVLTSDASGLASWQTPTSGADNLGNHTATQNVKLNGNWLSGDGGNEGVYVTPAGNVGIGTMSPGTRNLQIQDTSSTVMNSLVTSPANSAWLLFGDTDNDGMGAVRYLNSDDSMEFYVNQGTRVAIKSNGNVGIGTTNPGSYKLYVNGIAYSTGGWLGSDRRFKKNIETIESPLDKIKSIEGVSYEWKTSEHKDMGFPEGRHFGVIAQEVEEVLPEIVKEGPNGDKAVAYTELVPIMTEAIKQQQKQIEQQQKQIESLIRRIEILEINDHHNGPTSEKEVQL